VTDGRPTSDQVVRPGVTVTDELVAAIAGEAERVAREHHCPSIVWGLVSDGALAVHAATGTLDDGSVPDQHTVYRIASMTKSFTAATVLSLRDDGVLSLDDPIAAHAPELAGVRGPTDDAGPVRIEHLMTMTAGMVTDNPWGDRHLDITDDGLDDVVRKGLVFSGTTGSSFDYSNLGYGFLGRVVKRATGRPVQDLMRERILEPLGLAGTTWLRPEHDDWARPHRARDGAAIPDGMDPLGDGEIAPMGGLWSTVGDVARWITWLDDAFPARNGADDGPLSRASRREMQEHHRHTGTAVMHGRTVANGYGLGLRVRSDPAMGHVVSHSGGLPGYGSNMRWSAGRRFGVVALSNVTYAPMAEFTQAVFELTLEQGLFPSEAPVVAPLVHEFAARLAAVLNEWDDVAADALFADNVAPDEPYDRRRAQAERWRAECGGSFEIVRVEPVSAAAGRMFVRRPEGEPFELQFKLSPAGPPRIQKYAEIDDD
jgi:CubicO group peptidase (beta-lactamase class C family)